MKKILSVLNVTVYHIRSLKNNCESGDTKLMPLFPSLVVSSPLCILDLSRLTCIEKAAKNTTIFVLYKVLVYIQMSQPTTCFGLF